MAMEDDPIIAAIFYALYYIVTYFEDFLIFIVIILGFATATECLVIVSELIHKKVVSGIKKHEIHVDRLLIAWRHILAGILLLAVRELYNVIEKTKLVYIVYGYHVLGIMGFSILIIGLHEFHLLIKETEVKK